MPRRPKEPPKPKRRAPHTGSVVRRADGRVAVTLPPDLDPKRQPIYGPSRGRAFPDAEAATAWLDAEVARRRAPATTGANASETLGAYLARWYRNHSADWPPRTALAYGVSIRRWERIRHTPLGALTREVVQGAVAELQRATWQRKRKDGTPTTPPRLYSRRTVQHARTLLYQALDDLIPDVLAYNPARSRRRSRRDADPEQPVWSADQAERFMTTAEKIEPRMALAFRLILRRALRVGEVVALTWSDVDERARTLRIDQTAPLNRRSDDGPTKTRRVRDVPLSAALIARLREHRRSYPTTDPHVFTIQGERISLSYFRRLWHHVVRVAKVPPITPKDGRATCATLLLDEGWPLPVVSQLLGHTSIATTSQFYARVVTRRRDQIAQLGEDLDASLDRATARSAEEAPTRLRTADGTD
jgi:integrase